MSEQNVAELTIDKHVQFVFSGIFSLNPEIFNRMVKAVAEQRGCSVQEVLDAIRRMPPMEDF